MNQQPNEVNSNLKAPVFSKQRVIKNLMIISGSCLLSFTSHDGLLVLQSTLNREKGIGVISLAIQYAFSCLSALLLPKYLLKKFGCKAVLVVSMLCFFPFIASNFYPHWSLMISASVLLGIGYALLWSSHCAYLNYISRVYADHIQQVSTNEGCNNASFKDDVKALPESLMDHAGTSYGTNDSSSMVPHEAVANKALPESMTVRVGTSSATNGSLSKVPHEAVANKPLSGAGPANPVESITARFFGFHAMMYQLCYVTSNLISYFVFKSDSIQHVYISNSSCSCGADYCNIETECSEHNLAQPTDLTKYVLLSIFVVLSALSVVLVVLCLDSFRVNDGESVKLSLDLLLATCRRVKEKNQLLLIPISLFIGLGQGFYIGDFTKSYVGCAWGIQNIGIVTVCSGVTMALSSQISGWLVRNIGRFPIFLVAFLLDITVIVILLLWKPDSNTPYMFFIASGIWGSVFGILWSQVRAFYGILFKKDEEAAFGSYQLWHSVGTCLSLSYSNYICTYMKVYILLALSMLGFIGYFIVERSHSVSNKAHPSNNKECFS